MSAHRLALAFLLGCLIPAGAATTETLAPGVYHDKYQLSGPNVVHIIRMDLSRPEYKLQLGFAQKRRNYTAKEKVSLICPHYEATGNHVIAAVNGSFFNVASGDKGITGMLVDSAGYVQLANAIREMICFNDARKPAIEEAASGPSPTLTFADGTTMSINNYMWDRAADSLACYMSTWAPTTGTTTQGAEVIVSNVSYPIKPGKQVSGVVTAIRTGAASLNNAIPSGGLVLSAEGAAATTLLAKVAVGDRVYLMTTIDKPSFYWCNFALSGRGHLLRAGVPVDAGTAVNPYTALAWNATNFFMMTVDGRQTASVGMSWNQVASFLLHTVGATDAICLDGGGSTTMWISGEGIVNVPSDGSQRAVANAVMLVNQPTSSVFPLQDDFTSAGRSLKWDDKFTYSAVSSFSPSAPGGDGYVMTVKNSAGDVDSARVGDLADTNYTVEAQIYCEYRAALATNGYERCALFARDNGNQAFTSTTYKGNCYAMIYKTDTGQVQAAKLVDGVITDFLAASPRYLTTSAWHKFAIRCYGSNIVYLLDAAAICTTNDTTFERGYCGIAYHSQYSSNGNIHGTRADNFKAFVESTSLAGTGSPTNYGAAVTFTATVTGDSPTGTVQFRDGGVNLGSPVVLSGGQAQLSISTLSVSGSPHSITAVYSGDNNNGGGISSALLQTITPIISATLLTSSLNPSPVGSNVAFTATLKAAFGTPAGNVVFLANGTPFSTNTLIEGQAQASTASLPVGTNTITANYAPQGNYLASSKSRTQVVVPGPPSASTTSLTGAGRPTAYGAVVTFTATVTGNAPTGTVQFRDGGVNLGSPVALSGGQAQLGISTLSVSGSPHSITAVYSGDNNNSGSTSSALLQTITPIASATLLTSSLNPSTVGSSVTFTATVRAAFGTPAGNVVFLTNGTVFSTNALVDGVAQVSTASLPVGTNTLTANYATQDNYLASSKSRTQMVVACSLTNAIVGIVGNPNGSFTLTFQGTPEVGYYLVASPDATADMNTWTPVFGGTNTAPSPSGQWSLIVTDTPPRFYRLYRP